MELFKEAGELMLVAEGRVAGWWWWWWSLVTGGGVYRVDPGCGARGAAYEYLIRELELDLDVDLEAWKWRAAIFNFRRTSRVVSIQ